MPITSRSGLEATDLRSLNRASWLFADRNDYYQAFKDNVEVSFAAFQVNDFFRVEALCTAIASAFYPGSKWTVERERCLSRLVNEVRNDTKDIVFNPQLTATFRGKLKFLRR